MGEQHHTVWFFRNFTLWWYSNKCLIVGIHRKRLLVHTNYINKPHTHTHCPFPQREQKPSPQGAQCLTETRREQNICFIFISIQPSFDIVNLCLGLETKPNNTVCFGFVALHSEIWHPSLFGQCSNGTFIRKIPVCEYALNAFKVLLRHPSLTDPFNVCHIGSQQEQGGYHCRCKVPWKCFTNR